MSVWPAADGHGPVGQRRVPPQLVAPLGRARVATAVHRRAAGNAAVAAGSVRAHVLLAKGALGDGLLGASGPVAGDVVVFL